MKKFILPLLALAAITNITATIRPVDVAKDGIIIRVSNEEDKSEMLKSNNLACLYVRIKNDTGAPVEVSKYAVSGPLIASEKLLTEIQGSALKEVGKFIARLTIGTGVQWFPCAVGAFHTDHYNRYRLLHELFTF